MIQSSQARESRGANMAGYDRTVTISTSSSIPSARNDILRLTTPDAGHMVTNMDTFDHELRFEADPLLDDVDHTALPPLSFTPSYELSDTFSTTFEDPFSYQSGAAFEGLLDESSTSHGETNIGPELDNKLLGFGAPIMKAAVLDDAGQTWPAMTAELYGMFCVAEDVYTTTGRPIELTCYRRNLFQVSGTVTLSRSIAHMLNEQGQRIQIYDLTATISAFDSKGANAVIVSIPWKTSSNATTSNDKAEAAPPRCPLDLSMNPELDPTCVSIPVAWKRLQFKTATANNGRRKGLQSHNIIQINLMATLATTGETVKLAEIQSGPIIVRGRSPSNFNGRKDVPLNERKVEPRSRTMSDTGPPVKVDPAAAQSSYRIYAMSALQQPLDLPDWQTTSISPSISPSISNDSSQRPTKKPHLSTPQRPPVPKTRWKTEPRTPSTVAPPKPLHATAPIDLSLADEEQNREGKGSGLRSGGDPASPQLGRKAVSSPVETADLLYEYFPLSVDDWMPPVDAVYRPHVVHHMRLPPDVKAQQVKNKTKRYFSAED
ncbi:hypothetical protein B7494_g8468 [Chlorociboria aeruginascens]|nr:hypothetical protein B7494_g8468 [Chlorociboria aeruginascens]